MSNLIAITGKGGTGKTTLASLIIRALIDLKKGPVLAVDADPNSCLDIALGVTITATIGGAREQTRELAGKGLTQGIAKQQMLEMQIAQSMIESDGFDLIAMGRPEGPGCYCFANNVLRQAITALSSKYPYVVLDNEAGLENLSRRIVQKVNHLIIVADPSRQGVATIARLHTLSLEMGMEYDTLHVIINRTRRQFPQSAIDEIKNLTGAAQVVTMPDDVDLATNAEDGKTVFELSSSTLMVQSVTDFVRHLTDIN